MSKKDKKPGSYLADTEPRGHRLFGLWSIVDSGAWDRSYLDLVAPARLLIGDNGYGDIAFGAMEAGLNIEYGNEIAFFRWHGSDEGDEVSGSGSAELQEDGTLHIDLDSDYGDDVTLIAIRKDC